MIPEILKVSGIESPRLAEMLEERVHDWADYLRAEGEDVTDDQVRDAFAAALVGEFEPIQVIGPQITTARLAKHEGTTASVVAGLILTDTRTE